MGRKLLLIVIACVVSISFLLLLQHVFLSCIFVNAAYIYIRMLALSVFDTNQFALFTCRLVSSVIRVMGDTFTELKEHEKKITEIIKEEEASFCKTLAKVRDIRSLISVTPFRIYC